jgi:hypothetical protein
MSTRAACARRRSDTAAEHDVGKPKPNVARRACRKVLAARDENTVPVSSLLVRASRPFTCCFFNEITFFSSSNIPIIPGRQAQAFITGRS